MPLPQSKKNVGLGRALQNRKAKDALEARTSGRSSLHTTEVSGSNSGLRSVTAESALDEFLSTAALADADFAAERRNVTVVSAPPGAEGANRDRRKHNPYLLTGQEEMEVRKRMEDKKEGLRVPRRPAWTKSTTPAELNRLESDAFLEWRRGLAQLQEGSSGVSGTSGGDMAPSVHSTSSSGGFVLTPFERNLEVWRQLWRVVERSHLVVQIVDARNPLVFRCEDLENYVLECGWGAGIEQGDEKEAAKELKRNNLLLINKADLLDEGQRKLWAEYFTSQGVRFAFFSAADAAALQAARAAEEEAAANAGDQESSSEGEDAIEEEQDEEEDGEREEGEEKEEASGKEGQDSRIESESLEKETEDLSISARKGQPLAGKEASSRIQERSDLLASDPGIPTTTSSTEEPSTTNPLAASSSIDPTKVLNVFELESLFLASAPKGWEKVTPYGFNSAAPHSLAKPKLTVGLVGYPNVGKSSTLNALLGAKKVSVSSTPGKTKHFQTLHLSDDIVLCDCPGLVFPQFATTPAELVCDGVLPIDQMREYTGPSELVARRIPREVFEGEYGIRIKTREEEEGGDGNPTGLEVLTAYAAARGFMRSGKGNPDESRASRYVLKDYVNARLLYCHPPPGIDADSFNSAQRERARQSLKGRKFDPNLAFDESAKGAAGTGSIPIHLSSTSNAAPNQKPGTKTRALDAAFFSTDNTSSFKIKGRRVPPTASISGRVGPDGRPVDWDSQSNSGSVAGSTFGPEGKAGKKHFKKKRGKMRSGDGLD